jgi:hypothetical protein
VDGDAAGDGTVWLEDGDAVGAGRRAGHFTWTGDGDEPAGRFPPGDGDERAGRFAWTGDGDEEAVGGAPTAGTTGAWNPSPAQKLPSGGRHEADVCRWVTWPDAAGAAGPELRAR